VASGAPAKHLPPAQSSATSNEPPQTRPEQKQSAREGQQRALRVAHDSLRRRPLQPERRTYRVTGARPGSPLEACEQPARAPPPRGAAPQTWVYRESPPAFSHCPQDASTNHFAYRLQIENSTDAVSRQTQPFTANGALGKRTHPSAREPDAVRIGSITGRLGGREGMGRPAALSPFRARVGNGLRRDDPRRAGCGARPPGA